MGKQVLFRLDLNTVNGIPINIDSYNQRVFQQRLYNLIEKKYEYQNIPLHNYTDFNLLIERHTHTLVKYRNDTPPIKIDYFNTYIVPTFELIFDLLRPLVEIISIIQTI